MKRTNLFATCVLFAIVGCDHTRFVVEPHGDDRGEMNALAVNDYFADQADNAIVRQHTLYDYHFDRNGATLNELGSHEVAVIAAHFKTNPGRLNLHLPGAAEAINTSRQQSVRDALSKAGVDPAQVALGDELPGGDGIGSDRVIVILEEKQELSSDDSDRTTVAGSTSKGGSQ